VNRDAAVARLQTMTQNPKDENILVINPKDSRDRGAAKMVNLQGKARYATSLSSARGHRALTRTARTAPPHHTWAESHATALGCQLQAATTVLALEHSLHSHL